MSSVRTVSVWLILMTAEFIHGVLRVLLLAPHVGDLRARQICVFTGSLIILAVAWLFIGWIGARTRGSLIAVGAIWLGLTISFEIGLGRLVLGYSWGRLLEDYDVSKGGLLLLGAAFLLISPLLVARMRGLTKDHTITDELSQ